MKGWKKVLLAVSLSLLCLFTSLGYAALSDDLGIFGSAEMDYKEPEGLYISDVSIYAQNGVAVEDVSIVLPTNLQTTNLVTRENGSITYAITVTNKTDVTYWYLGTQWLNDNLANRLINSTGGIYITTKDNGSLDSTSFDREDWIPPKTDRVFYATYTFGANAQGSVSTIVNFNFGLHMGSVSDEFLRVLNDKTSEFGYYYLADAFNDAYAKKGSTVIGNVGEDAKIFDNLFGSNLTIDVDGNKTPVTIMVERKNMDKNASSGDSYQNSISLTGCEYTVYISVDNLSNPGAKAEVYAVSYTCGADGRWYQIGELYEGTSTVTDYDPSTSKQDGAFNVSTWEASTKEYWITDDISYKVASKGTGTTSEMLFKLEDLLSDNDNDFYNKVNNNSSKLLKPVCNILYTYMHGSNGQYTESPNTNNIQKPGYELLKAAFDELKPYCLIENGAQNVRIANANSLTRAQLIPMLERIQNAYDYYQSVNLN